jgi:hypothetical protein
MSTERPSDPRPDAPWTKWWEDGLPCRFSPEDAKKNQAFLEDILGRDWLQRAVGSKGHPLISEWTGNGAGAFLNLNALAEDIRLIAKVPHFDTVLEDLRDSRRYHSARHVMRVAAMFGRAGVTVSKFYAQTASKIPDLALSFKSTAANVEAKLLTMSEVEETFSNYAKSLMEQIRLVVMADEKVHPVVKIIVKNAHSLPEITALSEVIRVMLEGGRTELRSELYNVFVEAPPPTTSTLYREVLILCPRSDKENIRVESRVKDASYQLASDTASESPGILWIGLNENQDPLAIRSRLIFNFERGKFPSISSVVLSRWGTYFQPPRRSTIDLWSNIKNEKCLRPLANPIPFRALDLAGSLDSFFQVDGSLPAYRAAAVETRATPGFSGVRLADIRRVNPSWLE